MSHPLATLLPAGRVLTAPIDLAPYGVDGTPTLRGTAAAVVLPESVDEVRTVVRWCQETGTPVVTRGSGTGLSGGAVPVAAGLVLCLARMDRILAVDTANLTLRAEAGAITQQVADAAAAAGLFYPPDPGSMKISTIGGNIAENSGGLRGLKYGVTRDYVMALQVVWADGELAELGTACVKDVAGFGLKDLLIGSEGCLGIVTAATLKLLPQPAARRTLLALFDGMDAAAETVSAIIAAKIIPCTLEFLDRTTLGCVEAYARIGLPTDVEAVLLMETDGHPAAVADEAAAMERIARAQGARAVQVAADAAEGIRLATARRAAFSALARLRPTTILEDVTVPRSRLAEMVRAVQAIAVQHSVQIGTFGHFGDGNLHPTILCDERDTAEMRRVHAAMDAIFAAALALGGTITGEHGVGLAKKPYLPQQLGPSAMAALHRLKQAFDPKGILNPGKVL
jgi:glycolate oxidase